MKKTTTGFTLVELLIVIVVIAILAAISIVSYTGIQQRAANSSIANAVTQYVRALSLYAAEHGTYGRQPVQSVACLDGTTTCWGGSANQTQTTLVTNALQSVASALPSLGTHAFQWHDGTGYYIVFQLVNTAACPAISGTTYINSSISNDMRQCRVGLPDPA